MTSMPGSAAEPASAPLPATDGGSRTKIATGTNASTMIANARPK